MNFIKGIVGVFLLSLGISMFLSSLFIFFGISVLISNLGLGFTLAIPPALLLILSVMMLVFGAKLIQEGGKELSEFLIGILGIFVVLAFTVIGILIAGLTGLTMTALGVFITMVGIAIGTSMISYGFKLKGKIFRSLSYITKSFLQISKSIVEPIEKLMVIR